MNGTEIGLIYSTTFNIILLCAILWKSKPFIEEYRKAFKSKKGYGYVNIVGKDRRIKEHYVKIAGKSIRINKNTYITDPTKIYFRTTVSKQKVPFVKLKKFFNKEERLLKKIRDTERKQVKEEKQFDSKRDNLTSIIDSLKEKITFIDSKQTTLINKIKKRLWIDKLKSLESNLAKVNKKDVNNLNSTNDKLNILNEDLILIKKKKELEKEERKADLVDVNTNPYNLILRGNLPNYIYNEGNPDPLDLFNLDKPIVDASHLDNLIIDALTAPKPSMLNWFAEHKMTIIFIGIAILGVIYYIMQSQKGVGGGGALFA